MFLGIAILRLSEDRSFAAKIMGLCAMSLGSDLPEQESIKVELMRGIH